MSVTSRLTVLSGPSGVGKGTVVAELRRAGRQPRRPAQAFKIRDRSLRPPLLAFVPIDRPIEIKGCADQREVRQRLRKISDQVGAWAKLFRIELNVIAVSDQFFKIHPCFFFFKSLRKHTTGVGQWGLVPLQSAEVPEWQRVR